jgi:hypothetical protein
MQSPKINPFRSRVLPLVSGVPSPWTQESSVPERVSDEMSCDDSNYLRVKQLQTVHRVSGDDAAIALGVVGVLLPGASHSIKTGTHTLTCGFETHLCGKRSPPDC